MATAVSRLPSCCCRLDRFVNDWTNFCCGYCVWCRRQAKLWVQVIRQLRNGVKLKASGVGESVRKPIEYELTPYEMMMDDIRSRRYKLRQVMVDGTIPPRVKKDAHAVILEFIRSRPPLRKVYIHPSPILLFAYFPLSSWLCSFVQKWWLLFSTYVNLSFLVLDYVYFTMNRVVSWAIFIWWYLFVEILPGIREETSSAGSSRFYTGGIADGVDPATRFQRVAAHPVSPGRPNRWEEMTRH